jgi:hypothetical protein
MKKIIELFNFLTIGAFLSTIILFIGDLFGFSLSLNFQLLWRVLAGFLALTVLLNTGNIKKLLKVSTIPKKFLLLSGLNLFLFVLFLLLYPIFRFGSPFIWEDRITNFKAVKKIEITLNESLNQSFQAKSNNLGTIGLKIISQEIVIEEEPEEATPSAELTENEETDAVQGINTEGELDEELNGELYLGEPERIVFRIKEEEERNYFYENTYELNQYWETNYFLFGFPIQKDSEDKNYVFEIERTKEGGTNKVFLIERDSQGRFNFYPRYVYNLASLKTDWDPILLNISRKTTQFLEERINQINLMIVFLLIELLIFFFLKKDDKYFKKKIIPIFNYLFLVFLFLITISSLNFRLEGIYFSDKLNKFLTDYNLSIISLTSAFGFLTFYSCREMIVKESLKTSTQKEKTLTKIFPFLSLIFILVLFIFIRLPYFNTHFAVKFHPGKYVSYVPISQEMFQHKNPFYFSNPSYTKLLESAEEQRFTSFWRLPIFEWSLAPLFNFQNIFTKELIVRSHLTLLALILLISLFFFLWKLFSKEIAIIGTFIFSLTPFFHLLTWTTNMDLPALILIFFALNCFLKNKKELAFLLVGLAGLTKISFFIIGLGLFGILVLFEKDKIGNLLRLGFLSLFPYLVFQVLIRSIPATPDAYLENYSKLIIFIVLIVTVYYLFKKYGQKLSNLKHIKFHLPLILGLIAVVGSLFLFFINNKTGLQSLIAGSLTDFSLLFNFSFYKTLLNRIAEVNLSLVNILFPLSLLSLFFVGREKRKYLIAFLITSLFFLISASKSIRFSLYYNHIFIFTSLIFLCAFLFILISKLSTIWRAFLIGGLVFFFMLLILNPNFRYLNVYSKDPYLEQIKDTANYLNENMEQDGKALRFTSRERTLYLYIKKPIVNIAALEGEELDNVRQLIKDQGFYEAMGKYNIKYLITTQENPDFTKLTYLFTDETDLNAYDRTKIIISGINSENYYDDKVYTLYEVIRPDLYFELEKIFGRTKIYRIVPQQLYLNSY